MPGEVYLILMQTYEIIMPSLCQFGNVVLLHPVSLVQPEAHLSPQLDSHALLF